MSNDRQLVTDAYLYWQQHHSQQSLNINDIVSDLEQHFGLDTAQKKTLTMSLYAAQSRNIDELPQIPPAFLAQFSGNNANTSIAENIDNQTEEEQPAESAQLIITRQFFHQLVSILEKQHPDDFSELLVILKEEELEGMPKHLCPVLVSWANDSLEKIALPADINNDDCYAFSHSFYLLLTELVGPVSVDRWVSQVIDELMKTESARHFDPRSLL